MGALRALPIGRCASVVEALERLRTMSAAERMALRLSAFSYVQAHHSSVARVRQVLAALGAS
jgi:hypothetical protein